MADRDRLTRSLQESILTLLCFNEEQGDIVAGFVTPDLFEEPYRDIAARVLDYRERFKAPPGNTHIDDLFDHVLEDPDNRKQATYQRLLVGLVKQARELNAKYVAQRVTEFVRRQKLKQTVLEAAGRYQRSTGDAIGDEVADDVEAILMKGIRFRVEQLDPGLKLSSPKALNFLDIATDAYRLGIPFLDRRQLGPVRKEMLMMIKPRKKGKTWFLVHCGKQCMMQRAKVLHVSLEMSEDRVAQRYYQSLFAVGKRNEEFKQTFFEFDDLNRMTGFSQKTMRAKLNLDDHNIRRKLADHMDRWGTRLDNIRIKEFPTKALTINRFISYLDGLEAIEGWVPDVIILDYPDLMQTDANNQRVSIGNNLERLRGIGVDRNAAMIVVSQSNRLGESAKEITSDLIAEDISKVATADTIFAYSQTKQERQLNLARLSIVGARNDEDKMAFLISQSYRTGQWLVDSAQMTPRYWDQLKDKLHEEVDAEMDQAA